MSNKSDTTSANQSNEGSNTADTEDTADTTATQQWIDTIDDWDAVLDAPATEHRLAGEDDESTTTSLADSADESVTPSWERNTGTGFESLGTPESRSNESGNRSTESTEDGAD